tara:strand:- start:23 stop:166 length:144 start_codon:yes stop_codon:yes gene_type:complete
MLDIFKKIGLILTPVTITSHLIKENKEKAKQYCPIVKLKELIQMKTN